MIIEQTIDKLNWVKLCTMPREYQKQMESAEISSLSFDERFGMLVDAEWTSRQNKYLANLVRKAGMRYNAGIEEVIYKKDRNLDRQVMMQLSTCSWILERLNVIITGATGTGKTFIGCVLGNCACRTTTKSFICVSPGYLLI